MIEVEKGSFIPLIFTTSGGTGPLCKRLIKKIATSISDYKNEKYDDVVYHLRVRMRFALLRSTLIALRGKRGKQIRNVETVEETSFNLIHEFSHRRDK